MAVELTESSVAVPVPLAAPAPADITVIPDAERQSVVLVADDSAVVRALLRRQLEQHGHRVVEAEDGEQALDRVRTASPDIILLDVEMPVLDGHATLLRMREEPDLADIPVVFLTARTTTEDVVEGLRLGAHDYLRKPFEPAELIARVSAALRVKSLQDELRKRNAELDKMSNTDALTRLPNRRYLQERLTSECSLATRHGQPLGVLLIDVDHFKQVNDSLGHEVGDAVLHAVAGRLAVAGRAEDVAGRWGGEEFVVIAPSTGLEGAAKLAEQFRSTVSSEPVRLADGRSIAVTVSIGVAAAAVAAVAGEAIDGDALVRAADAALYKAKAAGRNVVVADTASA